jgi:hypothetical protein
MTTSRSSALRSSSHSAAFPGMLLAEASLETRREAVESEAASSETVALA